MLLVERLQTLEKRTQRIREQRERMEQATRIKSSNSFLCYKTVIGQQVQVTQHQAQQRSA